MKWRLVIVVFSFILQLSSSVFETTPTTPPRADIILEVETTQDTGILVRTTQDTGVEVLTTSDPGVQAQLTTEPGHPTPDSGEPQGGTDPPDGDGGDGYTIVVEDGRTPQVEINVIDKGVQCRVLHVEGECDLQLTLPPNTTHHLPNVTLIELETHIPDSVRCSARCTSPAGLLTTYTTTYHTPRDLLTITPITLLFVIAGAVLLTSLGILVFFVLKARRRNKRYHFVRTQFEAGYNLEGGGAGEGEVKSVVVRDSYNLVADG